jgi:PAS domain S-box-containing protein
MVFDHPRRLIPISAGLHQKFQTRGTDFMTGPPVDVTQVILDSIADGVFTVDLGWRITSFNRAAEKITGITRDEAIGRKCWEVFRSSICETCCSLRHTLASGESIVNSSVYIVNADGERIPISISTAILADRWGKAIGGVETFRDLSVVEELRKELNGRNIFLDIISKNSEMHRLFEMLELVANSDTTVLLEAESGTGKELFARAIHSLSHRKDGPLVTVNCGAIPDTLLESELFGYKAGAFTDAKKDKPGRLALAGGGTLFLDEIGDISWMKSATSHPCYRYACCVSCRTGSTSRWEAFNLSQPMHVSWRQPTKIWQNA